MAINKDPEKHGSSIAIDNSGKSIIDGEWSYGNQAFQRMMAQMTGSHFDSLDDQKEVDAKAQKDLEDYAAIAWLQSILENARSFGSSISEDFFNLSSKELESRGILSEREVMEANTADRDVAEMKILHIRGRGLNGDDLFLVGRRREEYLGQCSLDSECTDTTMRGLQKRLDAGFDKTRLPSFNLSSDERRSALARDIVVVSERYSSQAGMSARDFAAVIGGIATIESSFGTKREVKGTKHVSSASGSLHYLDGTMRGEISKLAADSPIRTLIRQMGIDITDGISKQEVRELKDNNILAGSVLARKIVDVVNENPSLRNDVHALTAEVYRRHNMGDAGARAFANGGIEAVNKVDSRIADNNPIFFRGTDNSAVVAERYNKFSANAVNAASPLLDAAFETKAVIAKVRHDMPAPQPA
ncbi:MAG TPA: hypothetical protein PKI93_05760 [Alphaproteobacteria bacterium]|nr:hypothetical protein [Alphaproteobacteria bacterium]HNS45408.1 hypothetical protein [Alphaproteobacteria bacterium]